MRKAESQRGFVSAEKLMAVHAAPRPHSVTIGWKEVVDLPDWGVHSLVAKSDTGARSSAIDVKNIVDQGNGWVEFDVVLNRRDEQQTLRIAAAITKKTRIRSSNGQTQERFKVKTAIEIGRVRKEVELSLVNRQQMICRVLLGRLALAPEFLVDPGRKYLQTKRRRATVSSIPRHRRHVSKKN